jgi:hypothetical protein
LRNRQNLTTGFSNRPVHLARFILENPQLYDPSG